MSCKKLVLGLTLLWSTPVFGQFLSPVTLNPSPALSTDQVAVEFTTGPCVGVFGEEGNPTVTIVDESIDVLIDGRWETNPQLCFNPPMFYRSIGIGSFPPGDYTVTVRFRYEPPFQPPQVELLGELNLSVREVPIHSVPSLGSWGISVLSVLFLLLGVWTCASHRF
jgi:hypothetical protein